MGLIELVRHEEEMRRLFGQQELKIIEKQLMGVGLSPSEITRLSRDIRPKFEVVLKLSKFENEFPLKKSQEIKFLINESMETLLENVATSGLKKIFVFGSYIDKKMRLNSDIDIAVEFKEISPREASKFKLEMVGKLDKKVQLSVFNVLPERIKKEILNKGKIIYEYGKG